MQSYSFDIIRHWFWIWRYLIYYCCLKILYLSLSTSFNLLKSSKSDLVLSGLLANLISYFIFYSFCDISYCYLRYLDYNSVYWSYTKISYSFLLFTSFYISFIYVDSPLFLYYNLEIWAFKDFTSSLYFYICSTYDLPFSLNKLFYLCILSIILSFSFSIYSRCFFSVVKR